jgi:hypothetical protein
MKNKIIVLPSFSVLGKEGSTRMGPGFIEKLWNEAENHLPEIASAVAYDGLLPIYWGLMSDFSRSFQPWEKDFSEGLYLAGFQLLDDQLIAPEGWVKWDVPSQKYYVKAIGEDYPASFKEGLQEIKALGYALSGAVFDHAEKGESFLYYPVEVLS